MSLLTVSHLSAGYGRKEILHDISFTSRPGTITGILGANGCGKTTLLKAIANILPHKGSCLLAENTLESLSARELAKQCGYIPQKSGITIDLTVLDVVLMGYHPDLSLLQPPTAQMIQTNRSHPDNYLHLTARFRSYALLSLPSIQRRSRKGCPVKAPLPPEKDLLFLVLTSLSASFFTKPFY